MANCSIQPTILHSIPTHHVARMPHLEPREVRAFSTRSQMLFLALSALLLRPSQSLAEDIPLFGLRKKLKKAEEEAKAIVKEGFEVVAGEKGFEEAVSFGGMAQVGTVATVEVFGVVIATAIVTEIIGPEGQRS